MRSPAADRSRPTLWDLSLIHICILSGKTALAGRAVGDAEGQRVSITWS